eukprot:TRINITY_DN101506_c0_g1_i1.p1 TRINITY_DN101506_c0_g1~~TRINITY_DN101506_c0_g1_i1.p1  ORF type:complete len:332 (-),score=32.10 TRINITY_DN101506_c0_g1_i1:96-1091(-)
MVRLRVGRFAWELYYTRTSAVIPKEEQRRKMSLYLGNLGYMTGLGEYLMEDMILLRSFAIAGCGMIAGFQLVQPKIQWISVIWNSVYCCINVGQIYLLKRGPPELVDDEAALFDALDGLVPEREVHKLAALGSWQSFTKGTVLTEEGGTPSDFVYILVEGDCDVTVGDLKVGELGPGSVVGEASLTSEVERSGATVIVPDWVRCLAIPADRLRSKLHSGYIWEQDPMLASAVQSLFARSLASKVRAMGQGSKEQEYQAVLQLACEASESSKSALAEAVSGYRQAHGISEDEHERLVSGLRKCNGKPPWLATAAAAPVHGPMPQGLTPSLAS